MTNGKSDRDAAKAPAAADAANIGTADAGDAPKAEFILVLKCISHLGWSLTDLQTAADEAGLALSPVSTPTSNQHIPGEWKRMPIAAFEHGRTIEYSMGRRQHEVRFAMDLQEHSPQPNALLLMRRTAEAMAGVLGAQVQLEHGTPVDDESIKPAAKWIKAVHTVRRQAARKVVDLPNGMRKERNEIVPWRGVVEGQQGRFVEWLDFDVEPMSYSRGRAHGNELMREFLTNLKGLTQPYRYSGRIADALASSLGQDWTKALRYEGKSRANVAGGMMDVVEQALIFFARNADFDGWLKREIASNTKMAEHHEKEDAIKREQRSVRSRIAHAKRREAAAQARSEAAAPAAGVTNGPRASKGGGGRPVKRAAAEAVAA